MIAFPGVATPPPVEPADSDSPATYKRSLAPPPAADLVAAADDGPALALAARDALVRVGFTGTRKALSDYQADWILEAVAEVESARELGTPVRNPGGLVRWLLKERKENHQRRRQVAAPVPPTGPLGTSLGGDRG